MIHTHSKYNVHTKFDREKHIQYAFDFLEKLSQRCVEADKKECCLEEVLNPLLSSLKLPLDLCNKISLVTKSIDEKSFDDSFLIFGGSFDRPEALRLFYENVSHRVYELYVGLVDVLFVIFGRLPSKKSMDNFLQRFFIYSSLDILEDKFKFHTMYLVCSLIPPSELPNGSLFDGEIPGIVIGGWVRRYFQSKKIPVTDKLKVAMSLQNSKRAAAAISERKQVLATIDHQQNMLGQNYKAPDQLVKMILPKIKDKIKLLVDHYYPKSLEKEIPIWKLPSQSACYENSSAKYGALGYMHKKFFTPYSNHDLGQLHLVDQTYSLEERVNVYSFGFDIIEAYLKCSESCEMAERNTASFHKVLEPFKLRGITAGSAEIQHMGRLLQPSLHKHLKDERGPFRFIGKRHNIDDIRDVYQSTVLVKEEERQRYKSGEIWGNPFSKTSFVAGDFKSATDCMNPELPKYFTECITERCNLSYIWNKVLNLTLGSHRIDYSKVFELDVIINRYPDLALKYLTVLDQKWGQLMGSPLSFPVLCIVNGACLWVSAELYESTKKSWNEVCKEYSALFNGDDASFLSNIDHYDVWKEVCEVAGFSLSAGKNYFTEKFININSTNYRTVIEDHGNHLVVAGIDEEFLVNPGLLKGRAKVQEDSRRDEISTESLLPVCDQLAECVRVASEDEKTRSYEVFHYHMKSRLEKSSRSWRLPRHLGGLGLPFGTISLGQMSIAIKLIDKYKDLSDIKSQGEFVDMSNDYIQQILPHFKDLGVEMVKPRILFEHDSDIDESVQLYETPSLSLCFLSKRDSKKNKDKIIEESIRKKTLRTTWKERHPEYKFQQALKGIWTKRNKLYRAQAEMAVGNPAFIETLCKTRLSRSGLTRELQLDSLKSREYSRWETDIEFRPWRLFY